LTHALETQKALLDCVASEWRKLPTPHPPWGVWIRQYPEMGLNEDHLNASLRPHRVWFLDKSGVHPRSVWEWQRFYTVQFEQPWCSRIWAKEPVKAFGAGQIAVAGFAPFAGTGSYYLEVQWNGLWGYGDEVALSADGSLLLLRDLWIS